jgi:hypothetical protein
MAQKNTRVRVRHSVLMVTCASMLGAFPLLLAQGPPTRAKFIRITETADVDGTPAWVIQNLRHYRGRDQAQATSSR